MKTNVYTTAMLGVAFAACLSACSTKSDVNGSEMTANNGATAGDDDEVKYLDYTTRRSGDIKVFDGEDTITLLSNSSETEDTLVVI